MGSLTNFGEGALIEHIIMETAYTPAATVYVALCTASAGEAATGASMNECANSGAYQRTAITFGAAASRRVTGTGTVTFPEATGSWGTVTSWAIVTSQTYGAGDVLAYGDFAASKSVVSGNTPSITGSEVHVEITASTGLSDYAAEGFLDRMFRNQAFTVSVNALGLATAVISDSDTGATVTEVASANGYARVAINAPLGADPAWAAQASQATSNAHAWDFPAATGSWGTITSAFITDNATHGAGNLLMYDNTNVVDQAVGDGDTVQFPIGDFDFSQT